jgi:uncharacterized protein YndB with AHSA1/START domain
MPVISSEIFIAAPPDRVWTVFTDFKAYPEWNTFNPTMECELRPGGAVRFEVVLDNSKPRIATANIVHVKEGEELLWEATPLYFAGLAKACHRFTITPNTSKDGRNGTMFLNHETLDGILAHVVPQSFFGSIQRGFDSMSEELKRRVEELNSTFSSKSES